MQLRVNDVQLHKLVWKPQFQFFIPRKSVEVISVH